MAVRHVIYQPGGTELSNGPYARVEPVIICGTDDSDKGALWETAPDFHNVFPGDTRPPALYGTLGSAVVASEVVPPVNEEIGEQ